MRPTLKHFRIYGPKNALIVDHDHQTVIKIKGSKYKSYLDKFVPPYNFGKQYLSNSVNNVYRFLRRDFHMKAGMKYLIELFYRSIIDDYPLPISYKEILMSLKIMDEIFIQINSKQ